MEEWRDISGYEGMYQISSYGRVWSIRKKKYLNPTLHEKGYLRVKLYKRVYTHGHRDYRIHQLVAEMFFGPCPPGKEVNHIDGDKTNNHINNLEYKTHQQNCMHASEHGLLARGSRNKAAKLNENQVKIIRIFSDLGMTNVGLSRLYHVSTFAIHKIIKRKRWKHV